VKREEINMSQSVNYKPSRRSHPSQLDELYIEHDGKKGWEHMRSDITLLLERMKRRVKLIFDKQTRSTMRVKHVRKQLRSVGISGLDLLKPESRYLASVLKPAELILAAICGKVDDEGSALLVVTDSRIIYLHQMPLLTTMDEVSYNMVDGISSHVGDWEATITLHTTVKDFEMHSVNVEAAHYFIYVVERFCITAQSILSERMVGV
jgi:hypothetical protein